MLEVKRLEPLLTDIANTVGRISLNNHLKSCQKIIENGWTEELDNSPLLAPLKHYTHDPLKSLFLKLFLLKSLFHIHKGNPNILEGGIEWIEQMRNNLSGKFQELCAESNVQLSYNNKRLHTLNNLEKLAQQRYTDSALSFIEPDTVKALFALTCVLTLINFYLGNNNHPLGSKAYLGISLTMLLATFVFGSMMVYAPPKLPNDVIAQNTLLQKSFLLSDAELNPSKGNSLAARLFERFFPANPDNEIVDDTDVHRELRHQRQPNVGATRRK
ncbi:MAG TPA: hypothetical protein VGV92_03135 [Gammaproteobacteria bacterium]|nr:hypothetical protein [Gammaproteobacteria bacterium]